MSLDSLPAEARQREIEALLNDCALHLTPVRREPFVATVSDTFDLPKHVLYEQIKRKLRQARHNVIHDATPQSLNALRRDTILPAIEIRQVVCEVILRDLLERGKLVNSDRGVFYVASDSGAVLDVADPEFLALCADRYGCNEAELEWKHLVSNVNSWARIHSPHVVVRELAYYDVKARVLFVDQGNGRLWRLDGHRISEHGNGSDDVFLRTPGLEPIKPQASQVTTWANTILSLLHVDGTAGIAPELMRLLVYVWLLGLFFAELLPTRPILCLVGEKGSAKTSFLRALGRALLGPAFDASAVSDALRDLETALVNGRLVVLDNLDGDGPSGLMNLLAMAATGGEISRRQLYTTATAVRFRLCCFVAITSRTPQFRRDDVAERLLVIGVARLKAFRPEADIMATVQAKRPHLWWVLLRELNRVVQQLKSAVKVEPITSFRLADFAIFGLRAVRPAQRPQWKAALAALQTAQANFLLVKDATAKALRRWLQEDSTRQGREWTAAQLAAELKTAGTAPTADQLGRRLQNEQDPLRAWFKVERRNKNGRSLYRLSLRKANEPGEVL